MSRDSLLVVEGVHKTYRLGKVDVPVLRGVDLRVEAGEWVAVLGASGSGKSTLLHVIAALDRPDAGAGRVMFHGVDVHGQSAAAQNRYRTTSVGFIFQFYHLLPELNVLENTELAAMVKYGRLGFARRRGAVHGRARKLIGSLGLAERERHRPVELSGGERQRVAIARALMNEPELLLADEPTGNLDAASGERLLDVIAETHRTGQTIIMVTHDQNVAKRADRVVRIVNGRVERG